MTYPIHCLYKVWNISATYGSPQTLTGHDGIVLALCVKEYVLLYNIFLFSSSNFLLHISSMSFISFSLSSAIPQPPIVQWCIRQDHQGMECEDIVDGSQLCGSWGPSVHAGCLQYNAVQWITTQHKGEYWSTTTCRCSISSLPPQVWDPTTRELLKTLPSQNHWVRALVTSDHYLYSGSYKSVKVERK